ncbi:MAG: tetratricopeptide repeat protein [Phycicoccus sp.]|nr:tetratricopeptide repeat protein [Phycicoccus sp.]
MAILLDPSPTEVRQGIRELKARRRSRGSQTILWLERLTPAGLDVLVSERLHTDPMNNVLIAATTQECELPDGISASIVQFHLGRMSAQEEKILRSHPDFSPFVAALDEGELLLGRLLVGLRDARDWLSEAGSSQVRWSVLSPLLDWSAAGFGAKVPIDALESLYASYLAMSASDAHEPKTPHVELDKQIPFGTAIELFENERDPSGVPWVRVDQAARAVSANPILVEVPRGSGWDSVRAPMVLWAVAGGVLERDEAGILARTEVARGESGRAYALLERHDLQDRELWLDIAQGLESDGDYDNARECLLRALEWRGDPGAASVLIRLADFDLKRGGTADARSSYERAARTQDPEFAPYAEAQLGDLEWSTQRIAPARAAFMRAVEFRHPRHSARAAVSLAKLEESVDRLKVARSVLRSVVELADDEYSAYVLVSLGDLEVRAGRVGPARRAFHLALKCSDAAQVSYAANQLGKLEGEARKIGKARLSHQRAMRLGHKDQAPRAAVLLGDLELGQDRLVEAKDAYEWAARSGHPRHAACAQWKMGNLFAEQQDFVSAEASFAASISHSHPRESAIAVVNLAEMYAQLNLPTEAVSVLRDGLQFSDDDYTARIYYALGAIYLDYGLPAQAKEALWKAVETDSSGVAGSAYCKLGTLEMRLGKWELARSAFREAIENGDDDHQDFASVHLGLVERYSGNVDAARRILAAAAASVDATRSSHALLHLGELEMLEGERATAIAHWRDGLAKRTSYSERCSRSLIEAGDLAEVEVPRRLWRYGDPKTTESEETRRKAQEARRVERVSQDRVSRSRLHAIYWKLRNLISRRRVALRLKDASRSVPEDLGL